MSWLQRIFSIIKIWMLSVIHTKAVNKKFFALTIIPGLLISCLLVIGLWFMETLRLSRGSSTGPEVILIVEALPSPPEVTLKVVLLDTPDVPSAAEELLATHQPTPQLNANGEDFGYTYLYNVMDRYAGGTTQRLLESYDDAPGIDENDIAWTYDNVLVILALLARGNEEDLTRAKVLVDALVYAQKHDPEFNDGRLRDAYRAGNFTNADGTVQIGSPGSATGNMAWAMLALLAYWESEGGNNYLQAAEDLGEWIFDNTYDERGSGGYTGGYDSNGTVYRWKATEHNADLYAAFVRLYEATGDVTWLARALHAKRFLQTLWNETDSHFWTGTTNDGETINPSPIPEDTQSWTYLTLGEAERYGMSLNWTLDQLLVTPCPNLTDESTSGVQFSNLGTGCWFEGSAHTILALQMLGDRTHADQLLSTLRQVQTSQGKDSGGVVAASPGGAVTGYGFAYPNTPHIGATAWYLFVERGYNPFWGINIDVPIPYEGFEVEQADSIAPPSFQQGMSYATWWQGQYSTPEADQALAELAATGAEWIALIVTCYQETYLDTEITCDLPRTPTDGDLAHVIQSAHNLGLKVMLKPHIDLNSDPDHWRGNIGQGFTEEQWQAWFNSYQVAITHYAMLAQAHKVEQFSVGTELVGTSQRETDWRQLITVVRKTYDGTLVYASNHGGEEQRITWWDALDYIGVDAYYPLTDKNNPTVAELEAAWEQPIAILETLHNRYKKPIILTEIGYRSVDGANRQPWEWGASGQVDGQEQADSYQAALQSLWGQPWLAGLYWWNWDTFPGQGGPGDTGFTPHNKPAEKVLQTYYQN